MDEEKKEPLTLERFMEAMYGVKPRTLTPEEDAHIRKLIVELQEDVKLQGGPEDA